MLQQYEERDHADRDLDRPEHGHQPHQVVANHPGHRHQPQPQPQLPGVIVRRPVGVAEQPGLAGQGDQKQVNTLHLLVKIINT